MDGWMLILNTRVLKIPMIDSKYAFDHIQGTLSIFLFIAIELKLYSTAGFSLILCSKYP